MSSRADVPTVPPEVDLGTRMKVIAAIDSTFDATVSEARHLSDAFWFNELLGLRRARVSLRALTQDGPMQEKIERVQDEGVTERLTHKVRSASVNPSPILLSGSNNGWGSFLAVTERISRLGYTKSTPPPEPKGNCSHC